jgi:hypothetical protein
MESNVGMHSCAGLFLLTMITGELVSVGVVVLVSPSAPEPAGLGSAGAP